MKRLNLTLLTIALAAALIAPVAQADDEPLAISLHSVGSALLNYVPNRANDVMDIVHASIGFGLGYAASVRATDQIHMGVADFDSLRFGWNECGVLPKVWDESLEAAGAGLGPFQCGDCGYDPAALGVGLHIGVIGADAEVDAYEVVDAVLGLLMIDISEDDEGPTVASRHEPF
ncbi:hypothetical protein JXA47_07710 [Candidatus Sumerlaeota bacterium]|nr:hypothetical protein [Candidatus Sumerlaeota bacterium]